MEHLDQEIKKIAHLALIMTITIFSLVLIILDLFLAWDIWTIPVMAAGVLFCFILHIGRISTEKTRRYVYSAVLLLEMFYYIVNTDTIYDCTPVVVIMLVLFAMVQERVLIYLGMAVGYFGMIFHILTVHNEGELTLTTSNIVRTIWHFVIVLLAGVIVTRLESLWRKTSETYEMRITGVEEENKRVNNFLANVSHEIRTPINAVIGLVAVMLHQEKDPKIKKEMRSVSDAGHRVARQISDILDYTEIDMGKLVVTNETYMLFSMLNDLIVELSGVMQTELELIFDVDANVPSVLSGDASKIKKILWHLIDNGLKFTKEGGVYIHLFSEERPYGINLCIEVKDTGIGMDQIELERIYDKFYQSDGGRTRAAGGLGLGIPILHGFAQRMGGFLTIDSEKENGTTVTVSIPQQVLDSAPCMSLENSRKLCVAGFFHFDKFEHPQVREFYNEMLGNLVKGLNVPFYRVENAEDLRRLVRHYQLTHLFVGEQEYESASKYIESLTSQMIVAVVAERDFEPSAYSKVKLMKKPFYCFPVVNILNMDMEGNGRSDEEEQMYCPGLKVLVVDDEPMNLIVAKGIFGNYGMEVTTVRSGQESIDACKNEKYDVVFMDHMMPEMDGIEAMHQIRTLAGRSGKDQETVIIALTANAVSSAKEMFLSEGFDGFVPKPIEITELERVLKRVLPKSAIAYKKTGEQTTTDTLSAAQSAVTAVKEPEEVTESEINTTPENAAGQAFAILEQAGIQTEIGLNYCQNDMEFYSTLLLEYAQGAEQKQQDIRRFYEEKDWENYAIRVHALKSTSKMIGADKLSELAKILEGAAKAKQESEIADRHEEALSLYRTVSESIFTFCGIYVKKDEIKDDEILEFPPEGDEQL